MKIILLKLLEILEIKYTGGTGTKVAYSGIYRYEDQYIALSKGERFPPYRDQHRGAQWRLIISV